jgi:hypothetical protein
MKPWKLKTTPANMKLRAEMVKLAQHIIKTMSAEFDPAMLHRNALVRTLRKKQAKMLGLPAPVNRSGRDSADPRRRRLPRQGAGEERWCDFGRYVPRPSRWLWQNSRYPQTLP